MPPAVSLPDASPHPVSLPPASQRPVPEGRMLDTPVVYRGYHGCLSRCHLGGWIGTARSFILISELPDNPGTSVTNRIEHLARAVCAVYSLAPERTIWIERTPGMPAGSHGDSFGPCFSELKARFRRVVFADLPHRLASPSWTAISRGEVERLLKTTLLDDLLSTQNGGSDPAPEQQPKEQNAEAEMLVEVMIAFLLPDDCPPQL